MALRYKAELTESAKEDLKAILKYSFQTHGEKTALDYNKLINDTFELLEIDPFRPGSKDQSDIADNVRSFHINLAKETVKSPIKNPRHILFYFTVEEDRLVISRALHDARDHTRSMEDIRRDVMEQAKLPDKEAPSRSKNRER